MKRPRLFVVIFWLAITAYLPVIFIQPAQAAPASTTVVCANSNGQQRSYQISWDNSNQFFADKGYIPAFYCTGGYASSYLIHVSDTLNGGPLGYYNGVISQPAAQDTTTATVDTSTASPSPAPESTPAAQPQVDSPTVSPSPEPSPSATPSSEPSPSPTSTPSAEPSPVVSDTPTLAPTPQPSPTQNPTSTPTPDPLPLPTPDPTPIVDPIPIIEPDPVVLPEPDPILEPDPIPDPVPEPEPTDEPELEPIVEPTPEPTEPETVVLNNGVVLTPEVAAAVALIQDPGALIAELFTNPGAALEALSNVGADMSPETREKAEDIVVGTIIVGQIAASALATTTSAANRRNP
jgi:hypothetical protein